MKLIKIKLKKYLLGIFALPLLLLFQNCSNSLQPNIATSASASNNIPDTNSPSDSKNPPVSDGTIPETDFIDISLNPAIAAMYSTSGFSTSIVTHESGNAVFLSARCQLDSMPLFDCSNKILNFSGLANGPHTFSMQASDNLGGKTMLYTYKFQVSVPPPSPNFLTLSFKTKIPSVLTSGSSITTSINVTPTGTSVLQSISCKLDNQAFNCSSLNINLQNISIGSHMLTINAIDNYGNSAQTLSSAFTISAPATQLSLFSSGFLDGASKTSPEQARDVAHFPNGDMVIVGGIASSDFTTINGFNKIYNAGAVVGTSTGALGILDTFVTRLSATGQIIWSSYLGGPNYDRAYAVEIDSHGDIIVAGRAGDQFPTTVGAVQPKFNGDIAPISNYGKQDGYVAKIAGDGSKVIWSTYVGDTGYGFIRDIALDSQNNVHLAMSGMSNIDSYTSQFTNVVQTKPSGGVDAAYMVLRADGQKIIYATYLGGNGTQAGVPSIRVGPDDSVYMLYEDDSTDAPIKNAYQTTSGGKKDLMLAKFKPTHNLDFLTYLGGSGDDAIETHNLALDPSGNIIIVANTQSLNFPGISPNAAQKSNQGNGDNVIVVLSSSGALLRASYFGGINLDFAQGVQTDLLGNIYVSGTTASPNFPVSTTALDKTLNGSSDAYVVIFANDLTRAKYSSFLGGSGNEQGRSCSLNPINGDLAVVGMIDTSAKNFPLLNALDTILNGTYAAYYTLFSVNVGP